MAEFVTMDVLSEVLDEHTPEGSVEYDLAVISCACGWDSVAGAPGGWPAHLRERVRARAVRLEAADLRLAISDPGAYVRREQDGAGMLARHESVPSWSARAVLHVIERGHG